MRLARSAGTDQEDVLALLEVTTLDELQHEWLVDAGPSLEVELIECLVGHALFSGSVPKQLRDPRESCHVSHIESHLRRPIERGSLSRLTSVYYLLYRCT